MEHWKFNNLRFMKKKPIFFLFSFFLFYLFFATINLKTQQESRDPLSSEAQIYVQKCGKIEEEIDKEGMRSRRLLGGPGSWPPRCNFKCRGCTPCRPVHVPLPPGTSVTAEYYPEAWRCKCGSKLFMP